MVSIGGAIIGLFGILAVACLSNFVAENYRRHLDGTTLAAALAGELKAHAAAVPSLKISLEVMSQRIDADQAVPFRELPPIADPIFDSATSKIGLLGNHLAFAVALIYEQLRAFRFAKMH
jgi:hypothetical protein